MSDVNVSVRMNRWLHDRVRQVARIRGERVSEVIREAVEAKCDEVLREQTLDVALKGLIGGLRSGSPGNAARSEEVFGEILEEKRRTGHL